MGIHSLKTSGFGTSQVSSVSAWPSIEHYQPPVGYVDTCIHVMPGDRLIVSSLDQGARLHEVQISWAAQPSPSSETGGRGLELSSIGVVTTNGRIARRPAAEDLAIRGKSHKAAAIQRMATAAHEPNTSSAKTQTPLLSRCFRLPRFTTLSEPDMRSAAAAPHFIDNVVIAATSSFR